MRSYIHDRRTCPIFDEKHMPRPSVVIASLVFPCLTVSFRYISAGKLLDHPLQSASAPPHLLLGFLCLCGGVQPRPDVEPILQDWGGKGG